MRDHLERVAWGAARLSAAVLFLAITASAPVRAQEPVPSPPPPDSSGVEAPATATPRSLEPEAPRPERTPVSLAPGLRGAPMFTWGDSTGLVLPPLADVRGAEEIREEIAASRALRDRSENRMLKAREMSVRWKTQVESQKLREDGLKKQIDAAKKEKREGDRRDLEAQKKRAQDQRDYFEAMRHVTEASAEYHRSAMQYAQARISAAELEQQLGERWSAGGYASRLTGDARALERRLLEAVKERADRMADLASREKSLTGERLDALKRWGELQN